MKTATDVVWRFDENRRKYTKPKGAGRLWGELIYREHWHPVEIIGETSRSWVTIYGKVPKSGPHPGWAFSEAEVDDNVWLNDHRGRISEAVRKVTNADTLRKVAKLIGYETTTP